MSNIAIKGATTGTGVFTLESPATNTDRTLTIPDVDGSIVTADASGNVGIGTSNPQKELHIASSQVDIRLEDTSGTSNYGEITYVDGRLILSSDKGSAVASSTIEFQVDNTECARIDSNGVLLVGKTDTLATSAGVIASPQNSGYLFVTNSNASGGNYVMGLNRQASDGTIVQFRQADTTEGTISVSGTTVSYNGGHLARCSQLTSGIKDESILKGTVLSNLDEMNVYLNAETGETAENEQLNKVKVSDVEGDKDVAGVFVSWIYDEQHQVEEINMAMTGDMIIRIAQGTTVARGDLLMSAGDGTAKPQGDDIVRSKTIAKVTSTNVTCTYADGSYCVPCVLMAC